MVNWKSWTLSGRTEPPLWALSGLLPLYIAIIVGPSVAALSGAQNSDFPQRKSAPNPYWSGWPIKGKCVNTYFSLDSCSFLKLFQNVFAVTWVRPSQIWLLGRFCGDIYHNYNAQLMFEKNNKMYSQKCWNSMQTAMMLTCKFILLLESSQAWNFILCCQLINCNVFFFLFLTWEGCWYFCMATLYIFRELSFFIEMGAIYERWQSHGPPFKRSKTLAPGGFGRKIDGQSS